MGEAKEPTHGQIHVDKDGNPYIAVDENSIKSDTITPDSIRDKEFEDLRGKLRRAKIITWVLFFVGLVLGAFVTWVLTALWG